MLNPSEIVDITNTVASALDVSLPVYRRTTALDGSGHTTETYPGTPTHTIACNVIKPTATELQTYAGIIGSKRALTIRVMSGADILESDHVAHDGTTWVVQAEMDAASYSVVTHYLMTTIT